MSRHFAAYLASLGCETLHAEPAGRVVLATRWNVEADGTVWCHRDDKPHGGAKPTPADLSLIAKARADFSEPAKSAAETRRDQALKVLADPVATLDALLGDTRRLRERAQAHGYEV